MIEYNEEKLGNYTGLMFDNKDVMMLVCMSGIGLSILMGQAPTPAMFDAFDSIPGQKTILDAAELVKRMQEGLDESGLFKETPS